jgi:hypothetical protein
MLVAATLLTVAAIGSTAAPAFADPSPAPTAPPSTGGPGTPGAADSITWAVQPSTQDGPDRRSSYTYTNIAPGTVVHDYVGVTNFSQTTVTFDVYASDAFNTTSGTLDLLASSETSKDVGAWVAIPKKTITIEPGARVNEPFTLTVPFDATPGDHVGGVIASVSAKASDTAKQGVQVEQRLAVPIYLRVSGDLTSGVAVESVSADYHGTFNPFGGGDADVAYTIHNTGNMRLDLATALSVVGPFGASLGSAKPPAVKDLLPGATFRITQHVHGVFPLGPLTVHVDATPSTPIGLPAPANGPHATSGEAGVWATPWPQLLLLVLIAGLVVGVLMYLRRGRERTQRKVATAVAKARRDTIQQLTSGDSDSTTVCT